KVVNSQRLSLTSLEVRALHGILPASVGEPADEPLNLSSECVFLTPVEAPEGEPSTSTSIAPLDPPQEIRGPE
ncbi:hypothetical protein GBF38_011458, partial [Nibea albiflora]